MECRPETCIPHLPEESDGGHGGYDCYGARRVKLRSVDYRLEWDSILPGLRKVLEHQNEGIRPEDVFCDLKMGIAALYLCEDGFIIFKVTTDAIGRRTLIINWAYSSAHEKVMAKYADEVDAIARELGCMKQSLMSTRRGYERALPE